MPIYRVTFHTDVLVESKDELDAERIGYNSLADEIRNGGSEVYSIEHITSVDQLHREERGSLLWRDSSAFDGPELTVEEILQQQE